ncbi:ISL3 family transposase [Ligilactobacillus salivarius]|uniref:ISL3 family transposase n=2 Tax=Ligilactobacillus salivarius TaxID=1624 RepID=A0AAX3X546_9LACO|nr:ISL3 family transposase [Ligilactobacillus salivarius]QXL48728.1 ISL3 family transposase [Ligilactobacillus salivarius]WII27990.1 ISL3 family transposase [Ligilactobacillus salivarius]
MDNNIKLLLGITDPNLTIDPKYQYTSYIEEKIIKNGKALLCHLYLSYPMYCPNCKTLMLHNGTKVVNNVHLSSAGKKLVLSIRKQKYLCPECKKTATAKFKDTNYHDHFSNAVKAKLVRDLSLSRPMCEIAADSFTSSNTIIRSLESVENNFKVNRNWLPSHLSLDDFKSGKRFLSSGMSMCLINAVNHRIIDIIPERNNKFLRNYFIQYSYKARLSVMTITVDLYAPYRSLIKELFPNAFIIADKFHVVTQAYTAMNKIRIRVMKEYGAGTHEYRALKRFWKLLLKNQDNVDYHRYYPRINFKYAELSDSEVLDRLFDMSSELKTAYEYYQLLLQMYRKNSCQLLNLLTDTSSWNLPPEMRQALKTIKKHKAEIENSFVLPKLTNGPIEGINNHIKVIKRIAYGYNNFKHFRLRILISLKNNVIFFST